MERLPLKTSPTAPIKSLLPEAGGKDVMRLQPGPTRAGADTLNQLNFKNLPNLRMDPFVRPGPGGSNPAQNPAAAGSAGAIGDTTKRTFDAASRAVSGMPVSPQASVSRRALEQASQGMAAFMSALSAPLGAGAGPAASRAGQSAQAAGALPPAAAREDRPRPVAAASQGAAMSASVAVSPGAPVAADRAGAKPEAGGGPILLLGNTGGGGGEAPLRRDPSEVLLETNHLLDQNPGDTRARADRAEALVEVGDYDAAIAEATKVLETDPASIKALNARAYANNKRGRFAFALQDADLVVRLDPDNAMGHLNRAMALEGLGRLAEALQEYARAAQLDPSLKTFLADAQARRASRPSSGGGRASSLTRAALGVFGVLLVAGAAVFVRARRRTAAAAKRAAGLSLRAGSVVGANYRIDKLIGEGGMGKVFEGFDTALRRKVAVKMMRAELRQKVGDAQILEEARLVALVRHPNVVEIFAALQEGGEIFLVFDFVAGRPLHALVESKRRLSLDEARSILGQIAAGLDCAHTKRVIHRDLKPGNVVISNEGVAKLMDFGIAHRSGPGEQSSVAVSGTLPYMAPEQHEGAVSPESDLYALGVMAYEMLTGRRPFEGADELDRKRRMQFAPAVSFAPELPPSVDAALARVLAADPARRFHSGKEFVDALAA